MKQCIPRKKIALSLEPAYQLIWHSLIWFFLFFTFFSASTYQAFNWLTVICVSLAFLLIFMKKGTFLKLTDDSIHFQYFKGLIVKTIPLKQIKTVIINESMKKICLMSVHDELVHCFFLKQKKKEQFLTQIDQLTDSIEIVIKQSHKVD